MEDLLTSTLVGLSFGNLWLCVLLTYTLQTTSKKCSLGFIIGRILSTELLSLTISLFGNLFDLPLGVLQLLSGVAILSYALYLMAKNRKSKKAEELEKDNHCNGECSNCPANHNSLCDSCHEDETTCLADESKVSLLEKMSVHNSIFYGLQLGVARGVLICGKMMLLLPILLESSPTKAITVSLVFAITSSIYPILGMLLGSCALRIVKQKRLLMSISTILLLAIGVKYLFTGISILAG